MFQRLTHFFEEEHILGHDTDLTLPITVKDLKKVYNHLAILSGSDKNVGNTSTHFENRADEVPVQNSDLVVLFDKLTEHYASESGRLGKYDVDSLINLFSKLADFYYGKENSEIGKMFEQMAGVFGRPSVFQIEDQKVEQIYDQMVSDGGEVLDDIKFEGVLVKDFKDLLKLHEGQKDEQVQKILDQLAREETVREDREMENDSEFAQVESRIQTLLGQIEKDQERMASLENQLIS